MLTKRCVQLNGECCRLACISLAWSVLAYWDHGACVLAWR